MDLSHYFYLSSTLFANEKIWKNVNMNALPLLTVIVRALAAARLEVVLIGNAAAALHGAPVTTLDFDFMFRQTNPNMVKLKKVARYLHAQVFAPYYPVSRLYRVVNEDMGLQVDFMATVHGIRSFESLRSRSTALTMAGETLIVASLSDIIASKKAANRPRDRAVLDILEKTLHASQEENTTPKKKKQKHDTGRKQGSVGRSGEGK